MVFRYKKSYAPTLDSQAEVRHSRRRLLIRKPNLCTYVNLWCSLLASCHPTTISKPQANGPLRPDRYPDGELWGDFFATGRNSGLPLGSAPRVLALSVPRHLSQDSSPNWVCRVYADLGHGNLMMKAGLLVCIAATAWMVLPIVFPSGLLQGALWALAQESCDRQFDASWWLVTHEKPDMPFGSSCGL